MELIVRRRAAFEVEEAFAHYEAEQQGLGVDFFRSFEAACARIAALPLGYSRYYRTARRFGMERFPFAILYLAEGELVSVIAVFHCRRDPAIIRARLEDEGA